MYFEEDKTRITTGKDITRDGDVGIWELDRKEIGTLYFSSCNTGNPDIVNVAEQFERNMYITDKIVAWDGGTIFNYATGECEMGAYGGWYKEWKRQPTYFRYVKKKGLYPLRKRMGRVIKYAHTWRAAS